MTEQTSEKKADALKKEMDELSAHAKELQSTLSALGKKIKNMADDDIKKLSKVTLAAGNNILKNTNEFLKKLIR
jgi:phage shock protein A